jgi:catalase-peroxidase
MGPRVLLLGNEVPETQLWQDPVPAVDHKLVSDADAANLKRQIMDAGLSIPELVRVAWASASTYRDTDKRGGANGARLRLAPQKDWEVNQPAELAKVLPALEKLQKAFNAQAGGKKISMADLIVLAGTAAVEEAAKKAGHAVKVAFTPGRTDATQDMTDVESFALLEPVADGFRNYGSKQGKAGSKRSPAELLVDKADLLNLSAPEMTVLLAGLRVLDANVAGAKHGVFTDRPGTLTNDFFVNLLDMSVQWQKSKDNVGVYEGRLRTTGEVKWTGTDVDLVFGANSQLRAIAEVYASDDAKAKFADEFAAVWSKVMNLDRFDLEPRRVALRTQR